MRLSPEDCQELIARAARGLPDRPAPKTLEARVLAEIERRASAPWWSRSYAFWPAPMRAGFFAASAAAASAIVLAIFAAAGSDPLARTVFSLLENARWFALLRSLSAVGPGVAGAVSRSIPTLWLYGGIAVALACYASVVGIGAVAYRALFIRNNPATRAP
jgi:hypothetical protein